MSFIREEVKEGLFNWFRDEEAQESGRIHIAMNLPASATNFLSAFNCLFKKEDISQLNVVHESRWPLIHVYAFSKADNQKVALKVECEKQLGRTLDDIQIKFVRNVAPKKDMFRISIPLTLDILCGTSELPNCECKNKRQKLS